jgi:hypothetical protein
LRRAVAAYVFFSFFIFVWTNVERWKKAAAGKGVREEKFNRLVAVQGGVATDVE